MEKIRDEYLRHMTRLFSHSGDDNKLSKSAAKGIQYYRNAALAVQQLIDQE